MRFIFRPRARTGCPLSQSLAVYPSEPAPIRGGRGRRADPVPSRRRHDLLLPAEKRSEMPASDDVERTDHVVPGDPEVRAGLPAEGPTALAVRVLDARRRLRHRQLRHGRPAVRPTVPARSASSACPSSTGWRPRRRIPGRSRTAIAGCAGPTSTPRSSASTATASASTGISAGGGLAAALALLARDRGEVPVAFQLLDCPMLDDRQITPSSRLDDLPVWSRDANDVRVAVVPRRPLRPRRRPVPPRPPGRPICRACRPRSCRSAPSTGSSTRTSTTPYG